MKRFLTRQFFLGLLIGLIIANIEIISLVNKLETLQKDNIELLQECTIKRIIK